MEKKREEVDDEDDEERASVCDHSIAGREDLGGKEAKPSRERDERVEEVMEPREASIIESSDS
jgi:hypothetical protein